MFFLMRKMPLQAKHAAFAELPTGRNQPASPRSNCMLNDVELLGLGRTGVIRAVAVVAIVVFPLIADAGLGRGSGAVKKSQDVSPVAGAPARTATGRGISRQRSCIAVANLANAD
jgi:hypothetical protein